jgi:hypothetical protein
MNITKVTPVRIVERIEPCLGFWCEGLGYEKRVEVPHAGRLGFVVLGGAAGEVMLQTRASLADDLPAVAARKPDVVLFVEVVSLVEARQARKAAGTEVLVAERTTSYGMRETVVVDPQGTVVILAQQASEKPEM